MKRLLITILIIINSLWVFGGYTVDSAIRFADQQYERGNYHLALKEYQRIGFHSHFSDASLLFQIGNCYLHLGNGNLARNYFDQVIRTSRVDSLLIKAEIMNISSLIREKAYKRALIELYGISDTVYQRHKNDIDLLFGITHFGLEEFETSKGYFKTLVSHDSLAAAKIDSLFAQKKMLYRPNPNMAFALSLIIPGLGQFYSGDIPEGLNSLFLNGALVALSVYVAAEYTILDAILSVVPWYHRYYMGGLGNATEIAETKRQDRRSRIYRETLDIIRESDAD